MGTVFSDHSGGDDTTSDSGSDTTGDADDSGNAIPGDGGDSGNAMPGDSGNAATGDTGDSGNAIPGDSSNAATGDGGNAMPGDSGNAATGDADEVEIRRRRAVELLSARLDSAGVRLLADTVLLGYDLLQHDPGALQASITIEEVWDAARRLAGEPLLETLLERMMERQLGAARCEHCQPPSTRSGLRVVGYNRSGSSVEGLADGTIGSKQKTSDHDVMVELAGSFGWAAVGAREPERISTRDAPQLWPRPTEHAGFVTLHWVRTSRCTHAQPLDALPADQLRLAMWHFCRMLYPTDAEFDRAGPAVNFRRPEHGDGGTDHVPCLRVPGWWPAEQQFAGRRRQADFPPAAARDDIRRFGVHLVPTGRPGSATEAIEWRVSFSRAEVVAVRHLTATQHATITTIKSMKKILRKPETTPEDNSKRTLKSYFIKSAVLWLAQDTPADGWDGVTDGVHRTLQWLEDHISSGHVPCFFWTEVNLIGELTSEDRQAVIRAVRELRERADRLLIAVCLDAFPLEVLLAEAAVTLAESGHGVAPAPLAHRDLRRRLARQLIRCAVKFGTLHREGAPCWQSWEEHCVPVLARAGRPELLRRLRRHFSGAYAQQCFLLLAWGVITSEDLEDATRQVTPHAELVTLDAAPLMALLTENDLKHVLGEPAAVAAWCRHQLQLPPEQRPAGLTAELDTPRGRADLLLQPELLLRAVREAVPRKFEEWQHEENEMASAWRKNFHAPLSYDACRREMFLYKLRDLEAHVRDGRPPLSPDEARITVARWRKRHRLLNTGDRYREAYDAVTIGWPDRWQLVQYLDTPNSSESRRVIVTQHFIIIIIVIVG